MFSFTIQARDLKEFKESVAKLYKEMSVEVKVEDQSLSQLKFDLEPKLDLDKEPEIKIEKPKKKKIGRPKAVLTPEQDAKIKSQLAEIATKQAVHDALQQVTSSKGIAAAKSILERFSANRLSDLPEENFSKFVQVCHDTCLG